ncbi:MAG: hypothetical protein ACK5SX_12795 [Sandaracinobacter sp.]
MGFFPRLAPENGDTAIGRLDRIRDIVRGSKFGIHDLSRCQAAVVGEYARMNMPFELGMDYGCAKFGNGALKQKSFLILEERRFDYHRALSDISGWDIHHHGGDFVRAVRIVSDWLVRQASADAIGPSRIQGNYATFQEWYYERELDRGASEDDIKSYPTQKVIAAMREWMDACGQF